MQKDNRKECQITKDLVHATKANGNSIKRYGHIAKFKS